jgi:hypothetical protein
MGPSLALLIPLFFVPTLVLVVVIIQLTEQDKLHKKRRRKDFKNYFE